MSKEDLFATVMDAMASGFRNKTIEENQEVYQKLQDVYKKHPNLFFSIVGSVVHDFNELVEATLNLPDSDDIYILEFIINGMYIGFHERRIEKLEGFAFSYDKASYIEQMTLKALKLNQNQSLYANYEDVPEIKEDKKRQAYWSPLSVQDTDEAMKLFWDWYYLKG